MHNPLWDYASKLYGLEGVAPACLALQDSFGLDVNLLLYAAWLAHRDQKLSAEHLAVLDASIADWRRHVIAPLRGVRRQLHGKEGFADLYEGVKVLELRAERAQLDRMYAFFSQSDVSPAGQQSLLDNLRVVARSVCPGGAGWEPAIVQLAALIPR